MAAVAWYYCAGNSVYCGSFVLNEMCQNRAANYTPVEENEIDHILRGEDKDATPKIVALIEQESQEFINDLLSGLRERMIELKSGKVVFLGGGAKLLRRQIEVSGKIRQATFVEDINANAKGYEYLYRLQHGVR